MGTQRDNHFINLNTNMKKLFTLLIIFFGSTVFAQNYTFNELLKKGKAELKKEDGQKDFGAAVAYLEKAVQLKPESAEAHYLLAYAYSGLNSPDGSGIVNMSLALVEKSSKEMETVIKLTKHYKGDFIILDPYSKISSEWGALAVGYWFSNKKDSAKWAFKESKKHGAFSDFLVAKGHAVLDLCSKNAYLISSGDMVSFPLWYAQIADGYRTDVSVIDKSLLSAKWFPEALVKEGIVQFDLPVNVVDSLDYCVWPDSVVTVDQFSWTIKPTYMGHYVLREDLEILSMFRQNAFKRDLFVTSPDTVLSLGEYMEPIILVDKFMLQEARVLTNQQYKNEITKLLQLVRLANMNSDEERNVVLGLRIDLIQRLAKAVDNDDKAFAKELLKLLNQYVDHKKYPYESDELRKYVESVETWI